METAAARVTDVRARGLAPLWTGAAAAFLAGSLLVAILVGPIGLGVGAVLGSIGEHLHVPGVSSSLSPTEDSILWQIRMPRVVLGALVGGMLALAGATYQGVFRNPLADPYLIGVATGAALGATIVVVSGAPASWQGFSVLPMAAFVGAMISVVVVYGIARVGNTVPTTTLILAGVAVSSLATALTSFLMLQNTSSTLTVFSVILGGFNTATWSKLAWMLPYAVPAAVIIMAHGRILNVLSLDEEQARHLGIDVERTKLLLLCLASLGSAAAVSVSGTIGFVGLIVPHAVRMLWGPDNRYLLPMTLVVGAAFLIGADLIARMADQPSEIPVGIVTALCGVPFFLYLLRRAKEAY